MMQDPLERAKLFMERANKAMLAASEQGADDVAEKYGLMLDRGMKVAEYHVKQRSQKGGAVTAVESGVPGQDDQQDPDAALQGALGSTPERFQEQNVFKDIEASKKRTSDLRSQFHRGLGEKPKTPIGDSIVKSLNEKTQTPIGDTILNSLSSPAALGTGDRNQTVDEYKDFLVQSGLANKEDLANVTYDNFRQLLQPQYLEQPGFPVRPVENPMRRKLSAYAAVEDKNKAQSAKQPGMTTPKPVGKQAIPLVDGGAERVEAQSSAVSGGAERVPTGAKPPGTKHWSDILFNILAPLLYGKSGMAMVERRNTAKTAVDEKQKDREYGEKLAGLRYQGRGESDETRNRLSEARVAMQLADKKTQHAAAPLNREISSIQRQLSDMSREFSSGLLTGPDRAKKEGPLNARLNALIDQLYAIQSGFEAQLGSE
jgi:hypothetical protein